MKKILFYTLLSAAAFIATSCDEDFNKDVAAPQEWPQEEAVTIPGFSVTAAPAIELGASDYVVAFNYTTPSNLPEGTTIGNFRLEITPDGVEEAKMVTVNADSEGKVANADLQKIIEDNYGKRPVERVLNAKVFANLLKGTQATLLTSDPIVIKVTPEAPVISSAYYLVGDMAGWNSTTMLKFNHSGKDVYEDAVFTLMVTTTAADQYWKIIPQENVDAEAGGNPDGFWQVGVVGVEVNGDDSMSGKLIANADAQAAKIANPGIYSITLNMMDYTYTIKEIAPEYYIVGAMQSWNSGAAGKTCMLYPQSTMIHSYTTRFTGDANMKLWLGSDFGNWDVCYGAMVDGDDSATGFLTGTGAGAIICPEKDAFYTFEADFSAMSYTWTKLDNQEPKAYTVISLIGAFNGWDQATNFDLVEVTPHNWYGAAVELTEGQLKFCADDNWADSWGGEGEDGGWNIRETNSGKSTYNGKNLFAPAGIYNVFFNDITGEFVFAVVE